MLEYLYPLYRPPSEANNIIIQVTYGCSYNNCSFCSMYVNKKYEVREATDIYAEIDLLSTTYMNSRKVFLADGDALSLPTSYLLELLKYLYTSFPKLTRVSLYASAQNIQNKSVGELKQLQENGLNLIYYGIETGNDIVLKKITKGVSSIEIIESLNKVSKAGIKISATVILGIGGQIYSKEHIEDTANIINKTTVNYLSTLQLHIDEEVSEKFYKSFDDFKMIDDISMLYEQRKFITLLNPMNKVIFRSNHVSNSLPLAGVLIKDKNRLINEIDRVLDIDKDKIVSKVYRSF